MKHTPKHRGMSRTVRLAGAGVVGIAAVAAGVANANAAHADVWDSVAQCESGGNWSINTGNGFYGGLQFTQSTWRANGGTGSPQNASAAEQKAVAQRVLATQGPGAWPVCSVKAGLTRANGGTAAAAPAAAPSTASRSTVRSAPVAPKAAAPKAAAPKTTVTKAAPKATTTKTTVTKSTTAAKPANTAVASGKTITVMGGDTLSQLAEKYHVKGGWKALFAANQSTVSNANLIFVGQVLQLPA